MLSLLFRRHNLRLCKICDVFARPIYLKLKSTLNYLLTSELFRVWGTNITVVARTTKLKDLPSITALYVRIRMFAVISVVTPDDYDVVYLL